MDSRLAVKFYFVVLALLLASCQPATNIAEIKKAIEEADARQVKAFADRDLQALIANYAPDAVVLPQNGPMVKGQDAMQEFFKEMLGMTNDFQFSMTSFDASGDLAYEIGTYRATFDMGMGPMNDNGKYLTIWKKQADGKWMIAADIFNTDMAPPMPPMMDDKKKK